LGFVLAALLEFRDRTFRSAKDIQDVLQLPLVARVPFVMLAADGSRRRRFRIMAAATVLLLSVVGVCVLWVLQLWKFVVSEKTWDASTKPCGALDVSGLIRTLCGVL